MTLKDSAKVRTFIPLVIIITTTSFLAYLNCIKNDFVFDDIYIVQKNPLVANIKDTPAILLDNIRNFTIGYRLLRIISYQIDYLFSGRDPIVYHISNILYHTISSCIIFFFTRLLTNKIGLSFFVSLVFSLHPINTDSVTYISGRRDILSGLFFFLGFFCFVTYRRSAKYRYLFIAIIAYIFGIFSKEMAASLPIIFFLYDLILHYRTYPIIGGIEDEESKDKVNPLMLLFRLIGKTLWDERYLYIPLLLFSLIFGIRYVLKEAILGIKYYGDSPIYNLMTVITIWFYYVKKILLPFSLLADYTNSFPIVSSIANLKVWGMICLLLCILYYIIKRERFSSLVSMGFLWFFITLLPVSHIVPHHELMAEHYLYIPSYGIILLFSSYIYLLKDSMNYYKRQGSLIYSLSNNSFIILLLLIVLFLAINTSTRNYIWRDEATLWEDTVKKAPYSNRANINFGLALSNKKLYYWARQYFLKAIDIRKDSFEAYNNIGYIYYSLGFIDKAVLEFRKSLMVNPEYEVARANLGGMYIKAGKNDEAILQYKEILKNKRAFHYEALLNLGMAYNKKGMKFKAIFSIKEAIQTKPDYYEAYNNLGGLLANLGFMEKAVDNFRLALLYNPDYEKAKKNLLKANKLLALRYQ